MQRRFAIILGGGRSARMGRDKRALLLDGRSLLALAVDACAGRDSIVVVTPELPADVDPGRVVRVLEDPPFGGPVAGIAAGVAALPAALPDDEILLLACDLPRVADIVAVLDALPPVEQPPVEPAETGPPAPPVEPAETRPGPQVSTSSTNEIAQPGGSTGPSDATPTGVSTSSTSDGRRPTGAGIDPDGVCLLDAEDYPQYLAARYRRPALEARLAAVGDPRAQSVRRLMGGLELRRIAAPGITGDVDTPDDAAAAGIDA